MNRTLKDIDPSAPPPDICEWAKNNVYISARVTRRQGFYDAGFTAYIREVLRSIVDPHVREVALQFGAQVGKSQSLNVALAYLWRWYPGPTMFVQPTDIDVQAYGNKRLKPMLEDSPGLRYLIPADRKRLFRGDEYTLTTCNVFLRGAGSPSSLASWACRYVVTDETGKFPPEFTSEGDPVELLRQRLKTYAGVSKYISDSTPTTEDGAITRQFKDGDRREYFIRCENCGAWQPLTFKDVTFDNNPDASPASISKSARLKCRNCGAMYSTTDKNRLVQSGEWRPQTVPAVTGARSYHLESIASPWVSLEYLVEAFVKAKRSGKTALRVFVNSELAQPWVDADDHLDGVRLQALEGDYAEGESFPALADEDPEHLDRCRVGGVDVQKDYLAVVFREYAYGGASGMVWHHRVATFAELAEMMDKYNIEMCCIDCRYRGDEVFAACARYPQMQPCQGSVIRDGTLFRFARRTVTRGHATRRNHGSIREITYDQSALFDYVAEGLRGDRRWMVPRGTSQDAEYCEQVTAKRLIAGRWGAPAKVDDHYADAEKLCMLGALIYGFLIPKEDTYTPPAADDASAE